MSSVQYPSTPELDKLDRTMKERALLSDFLEWMNHEKQLVRCQLHLHADGCYEVGRSDGVLVCGLVEGFYYPSILTQEQLIAEFSKLDLNKIDEEKKAVLEYVKQKAREGKFDELGDR